MQLPTMEYSSLAKHVLLQTTLMAKTRFANNRVRQWKPCRQQALNHHCFWEIAVSTSASNAYADINGGNRSKATRGTRCARVHEWHRN